MDWTLAIGRNRQALRTMVLALFALARMRVGGALFTLPRSTFTLIMLVLRPAESCVRRLIVIAALGLKLKPQKPRDWRDLPNFGGDAGAADRGVCFRAPAFALFEPLKSFDPDAIRDVEPVWQSGFEFPHACVDNPDQPVDATRLGKRLAALIHALDTIPHQARRLLRHCARRDTKLATGIPARISPIRPGLPPGWRERPIHAIDDVLKECHRLAIDRLNGA